MTKRKLPELKGKLLVWDLETTYSGFKANTGHLMTWAAKFIGEKKVYTGIIADVPGYGKTPKSFTHDKPMVKELIALLKEADALVHHYGDRFDLPYLNTRALHWKMLPPGKIATIDTWKVARQNLAMTSNRLATLADYLAEHKKGGLSPTVWAAATHGCRKSQKQILEYNVGDILATEDVYIRLRPLIYNHPHVWHAEAGRGKETQCPACGSYNVVGDGSYRTKRFLVHRGRCRDCGSSAEISRSGIK